MNEQQLYEVDWYSKNGFYPERIRHDSSGQPYVIGDLDWNKNYPAKHEHFEYRCMFVPIDYCKRVRPTP